MSTSNHVIGLPQPHLDRTALCDIDESEYDKRYLDARTRLRALIKDDLPSRPLRKDVNGPDLADMCVLVCCLLSVVCCLLFVVVIVHADPHPPTSPPPSSSGSRRPSPP